LPGQTTSRRLAIPGLAVALTLTLSLLALAACDRQGPPPGGPAAAGTVGGGVDHLVFAETHEFWTAPTLLAGILDLYRQVGLDVKVAKFDDGLAAKNAVLSRSADVGLAATTPLAIAGFQHEPLALIVTYFESNGVVKLAGRSGAGGPVTPAYLRGRRVGYVPGTISAIVLDRMLDKVRIAPSAIVRASFRPPELIPALGRGDIDAFVAWEPWPLLARQKIPTATEFVDRSLYTVRLHLVTRPEVIDAKRGALVKLLRALRLAEDRLAADPAGSRARIESAIGFRPGALAAVWPDLHFTLQLDKPLLLESLRSDGRWIQQSGAVKGPLPDYGGMLRDDVLRAYQAEEGR
jgi:NitT/TauT family transport system substrate-binding protein